MATQYPLDFAAFSRQLSAFFRLSCFSFSSKSPTNLKPPANLNCTTSSCVNTLISLLGKAVYTKCTSIRLPNALAYLHNVSMLSECLPETKALSNRATAGALVPMRSATCAYDKPAARLAGRISSNMANSLRFRRWYSARTTGLSSIFAFNSACVSMFNLPHSSFSNTQFAQWRFLRLFNKTVQHHNSPFNHNAPLNQGAIKHTANTLGAFKPQFKHTIAKGLGMRLAQVSTKHFHTVGQCNIAATHPYGKAKISACTVSL